MTDIMSRFNNANEIAIKHRLVLSSMGRESRGKTHFSLTAPGPIAVLNIDMGLEGVVDKFNDKVIMYQDYIFNKDIGDEAEYARVWSNAKDDFYDALRTEKLRTIVVDTWTEMYDLVRLAEFGRLEKVLPFYYSKVNSQVNAMIHEALLHDKNVILISKVKAEYIDDRATGQYVRAGYKDTGFLVQVEIRHYKNDDDEFAIKIEKSRINNKLVGEHLSGELCSFPMLASLVFPDTSPEDWV